MTHDPLAQLAAFAAGGRWPAGFATTETHLILCFDDVRDLEPLFTSHAAGITSDTEFTIEVLAPLADFDALFGLTVTFADTATRIRVLLWVDANRSVLDALIDRRAVTLMSRAAFDALPSSEPHSEAVSLPLPDVDLRPLEAAIARPRSEFGRTTTGWRVATQTTPAVEGAVERRAFADAAAFEAVRVELAAQGPRDHLVAADASTLTIEAVGFTASVESFLAGLPAEATPLVHSEPQARSLWARFMLELARAVVRGDDGPHRDAPVIVVQRVTGVDANHGVTALFIAYAYDSDELSRQVFDQVERLLAGATFGHLTRFRVGDEPADHRWVVVAMTLEHRVKDTLAHHDWGPGAICVSDSLTEDIMVRALDRGLGLDRSLVRLERVPVMLRGSDGP